MGADLCLYRFKNGEYENVEKEFNWSDSRVCLREDIFLGDRFKVTSIDYSSYEGIIFFRTNKDCILKIKDHLEEMVRLNELNIFECADILYILRIMRENEDIYLSWSN